MLGASGASVGATVSAGLGAGVVGGIVSTAAGAVDAGPEGADPAGTEETRAGAGPVCTVAAVGEGAFCETAPGGSSMVPVAAALLSAAPRIDGRLGMLFCVRNQ